MSNTKQQENLNLEEIPVNNAPVIKTEIFEIENQENSLIEPPQMNVSVPEQKETSLISDSQYLDVLGEILSNIREDRKQVSDYIDNFAEMVINEGDATTSTKEALVNLVKVKTDLQDKMIRTYSIRFYATNSHFVFKI